MTTAAYRSEVVLDPSPAELLARRESLGKPAGMVARLMGVTAGRLRAWELGRVGITPENHAAWVDALDRAEAGEEPARERKEPVCWDLWIPPITYRLWTERHDPTELTCAAI